MLRGVSASPINVGPRPCVRRLDAREGPAPLKHSRRGGPPRSLRGLLARQAAHGFRSFWMFLPIIPTYFRLRACCNLHDGLRLSDGLCFCGVSRERLLTSP